MKVSIVIRCYNEGRHIGRLLQGIAQQTIPAEVIVVDSGSTDNTLDTVAGYDCTLIRIAPDQFSFGRALNIGCERASGDVIVAISAHCWPVYKDWLERLVAPFGDPAVGLTYGKQRGCGLSAYSELQIFRRWFGEEGEVAQAHPFCNNANAAVRRSVWQDLRYDESLTGLEDLEFAKRMLARGPRIAYCADAEVIHLHEQPWSKVFIRYQREAVALRRIFPEERFGLWDFARLTFSNILGDWAHAWHDGCLRKQFIPVVLFRVGQFAGTWSGYRLRTPINVALRERFYYSRGILKAAPQQAIHHHGERITYGDVPGGLRNS